HLSQMAKLTGGTANFLTEAQYIKQYGKDTIDVPGGTGKSTSMVDKVDADEYPIEFDLTKK
ncbi:MAG: hypothetical protein NWS71_12455, partial [Opitutales bacterium]|nr:hypothetical protein [Opitutales bacterium]